MTVSENHYCREQKGGAFMGPLICFGTPTVGSSLIDRFQPALLGKLNGLGGYMRMRGPPDVTSAATKFATMGV
jgi:hypothetical protein